MVGGRDENGGGDENIKNDLALENCCHSIVTDIVNNEII